MIVTKQVKQPVEGKHAQLGLKRMSCLARLARRHAGGDDQVTQRTFAVRGSVFGIGREAQDVSGVVLTAVTAVQHAHAPVGHQRDAEIPLRTPRRDAGEPARKAAVTDCASAPICDGDA